MWRNINQLIGKTSKTTNLTSVKSNYQIFTNKDDIAETFNDYFSKIGTELSNRIPPSSKGFEEYLERSVTAVFEFKSMRRGIGHYSELIINMLNSKYTWHILHTQ